MTTKLRAESFTNLAAEASDHNNTSTGFFDLPKGTTAQRPASAANGMVRYNTTLEVSEEYRDGAWNTLSNVFQASGGTETSITQDGNSYKVHTFTSSGAFTVVS